MDAETVTMTKQEYVVDLMRVQMQTWVQAYKWGTDKTEDEAKMAFFDYIDSLAGAEKEQVQ